MRALVIATVAVLLLGGQRVDAQRGPADSFILDRAHAVIRGQAPYISMACDVSPTARFEFRDEQILARGAQNVAGQYWPVRVRSGGTLSCELPGGSLAMSFTMTLVLRLGRDDFGEWNLRSFEVESRTVEPAEAPLTPEESARETLRNFFTAQEANNIDNGKYAMRVEELTIFRVTPGVTIRVWSSNPPSSYLARAHDSRQPTDRFCWVHVGESSTLPVAEVWCGDEKTFRSVSQIAIDPTPLSARRALGTVHVVKLVGDEGGYRFVPEEMHIRTGDAISFQVVTGGPYEFAFDLPTDGATAAWRQLLANLRAAGGTENLSGLLESSKRPFVLSFGGVAPGTFTVTSVLPIAGGMRGRITVSAAR